MYFYIFCIWIRNTNKFGWLLGRSTRSTCSMSSQSPKIRLFLVLAAHEVPGGVFSLVKNLEEKRIILHSSCYLRDFLIIWCQNTRRFWKIPLWSTCSTRDCAGWSSREGKIRLDKNPFCWKSHISLIPLLPRRHPFQPHSLKDLEYISSHYTIYWVSMKIFLLETSESKCTEKQILRNLKS